MRYSCPDSSFEGVIASGDIGGTNFRLALIEFHQGTCTLLHKETHSTPEMQHPEKFLLQLVQDWEKRFSRHISGFGLALAGPVNQQTCRMTNANLYLDGASIMSSTGRPVWLLNDLSGISYGISILDHQDSAAVIHIGGPALHGGSNKTIRKAVVAPGTGLGVGSLVIRNRQTIVLDAEAGHTSFAPATPEQQALRDFVQQRFSHTPGYEQFVSGIGLENLFDFYCAQPGLEKTAAVVEISKCPVGQRGALISAHAATDALCQKIMTQFSEMLGQFSSAIALGCLPRDGLYLAGGIPAKNLQWLTDQNRFINSFQKNYQPGISSLLHEIPVYAVTDGDIGLYGAAWACVSENRL